MPTGDFFDSGSNQHQKTGSGGDRRQDEEEKSRRPDEDSVAECERTPAQHAVQSAQRSLVKEGEQRTHASEYWHKLVKLMFKDQERRELAELAVAQKNRNIFQAAARANSKRCRR